MRFGFSCCAPVNRDGIGSMSGYDNFFNEDFDNDKFPDSPVTHVADLFQKTTIFVRNLPVEFTRSILLALLDSEGFAHRYDFVYMPCNFKHQWVSAMRS